MNLGAIVPKDITLKRNANSKSCCKRKRRVVVPTDETMMVVAAIAITSGKAQSGITVKYKPVFYLIVTQHTHQSNAINFKSLQLRMCIIIGGIA